MVPSFEASHCLSNWLVLSRVLLQGPVLEVG